MRPFIICCLLAFATAGPALEPVNPDLNATARSVLDYLESIYGQHTIVGYNTYSHTADDYSSTGKRGGVQGFDLNWYSSNDTVATLWTERRVLISLHWHWAFDGDSAWKGKRDTPVDVGAMVTPGTPEHEQAMIELAEKADVLQGLEDQDVPVLFRPLHEIDGGWFWWTDKDNPANTAALWRMIYDYMVEERGLDNLIWVYSAATGLKRTVEYRLPFYPGAEYVDISGIDIYFIDFDTDVTDYNAYFDIMSAVTPGKMMALGECQAMPDPDKMADDTNPRWLWAMPWYGVGFNGRSYDWGMHEMWHAQTLTLDELPAFGSGNIHPQVGMITPLDDGSGWFPESDPVLQAYAVDRDGEVDRLEFYAGEELIGTVDSAPYRFTWQDAPAGCYSITAVAIDDAGAQTTSNRVRIGVGLVDAARRRPVTASTNPDAASKTTDGDYYTKWGSDKNDTSPDDEWVRVDLGHPMTIDRINLLWHWKIFATDFAIEICTDDPAVAGNWTTVYEETGYSPGDMDYWRWKLTKRVAFDPVEARYVRAHFFKRKQDWGGYSFAALEVPVPPGSGRAIDLRVRDGDQPVPILPAIDPDGPAVGVEPDHRWVTLDPAANHHITLVSLHGEG